MRFLGHWRGNFRLRGDFGRQLGTVEALFLVLDFLQTVALVLFVLREAVELVALA